jgi:exodeoxyribonuclease V alpha subunit
MSFSRVVEIKSVFPSPLGGAVFKGIPVGRFKKKSFRAPRYTVSRIPAEGEFWKIEGQILEDPKYGDVVIVTNAFLHELPSFNYVGKLLENHPAFRGFHFGKAKVKKLVDAAGKYALVDILNKSDVNALIDSGLSEPIATRVCDAWSKLKEETEVATFLHEHKLDSTLAKKIIRLCKHDTVSRLKRNPFALIALSNANRKNLLTIARVGEKLGIPPDDDRVQIGAVEYAMYRELDTGSTVVQLSKALKRIKDALSTIKSNSDPEAAVRVALAAKTICVFERDGETYLQTIAVAYIEQYVEDRLSDLHHTPIPQSLFSFDSASLRERIETYNSNQFAGGGFALNREQNYAVEMALQNRISLISGYGGTGKTTVLRSIVRLARESLIPVFVCALAGKAANRASQSIGEKATTIHSFIHRINNDRNIEEELNSDPLIIVDESSMIDMSLICALLKALGGKNVRFLFVGDTAQLPPIGFGLFYHKLVKSNVPQTRLVQAHRQADGSPLHDAAMSIRNKQPHVLPTYKGQEQGIYLLEPDKNPKQTVIKLRKELHSMILTPYSSGRFFTSTEALNPVIQEVVNSQDESRLKLKLGAHVLQIGDPVIVTKNVGHLGLFNGMTGVVTDITVDGETLCTVFFEGSDSQTTLTRDQAWELGLQLAYVITIHKSQGSEYEVCAIILGGPMIENSALYTAITRTQKLCIVVGTQEMYDEALTRPPRYETVECGFSPSFVRKPLKVATHST